MLRVVFVLFSAIAASYGQSPSGVVVPDSPDKGSWGGARLRGINIYGAFTPKDFQDLKAWKVDHVRYQMVRPKLVKGSDGWELEAKFKDAIDAILTLAEAVDIKVILDLHDQSPFFPGDLWKSETLANWENPENRQKLASLWKWLAGIYKDRRIVAGYEILNEPAPPRNERGYRALNEINKEVTKAIREVDGWHTIIVSGPEYSRPAKMDMLEATGDPNTVYTFHMYEPTELTHQGVTWMNAPAGVTYPGIIPLGWNEPRTPTMVDKKFLSEKMAAVATFRKKYNARIWVGEFSCRRVAPANSAYAWIKDALELFEAEGWDWCYHCFREDRYGTGNATFGIEHAWDAKKEEITPETRTETDRLRLLKSYWQNRAGK